MITLTLTSVTATTAALSISGYNSSGATILQVSPSPTFDFCVCPSYPFTPAASQTLVGLNQRATYYVRGRNRATDGTVDEWGPVIGFRTQDATAQITTPAAVMIEPAVVVLPEKVLTFSDAFNQTVPGFPMDNLGRDAPVAYRGQSASDYFSIFMQTAGGYIDTVALLQTNLPENAVWAIIAGPTLQSVQTVSGISYYSSEIPFRASANLPGRHGYHGLHRLPSPVSAPWWRIAILRTSVPANIMHAEYVVLGRNRASRNHAQDKTETAVPLGSIERRRSGVPDRLRGLAMRKVDFDIANMTEQQYETIYRDLIYAQTRPVLVVPNSKPGPFLHDRILFGDFEGGRVVNTTSPRYTRSFSVSSLI